MSLRVVPIELDTANAVVRAVHRHHDPVVGHRFSLGVLSGDVLCGVAIVGRPVARPLPKLRVVEVSRLATDGTYNACSILYGAAARAAKAIGYDKIQTYVLPQEGGASLRAAGWVDEGPAGGRQWEHTDGKPRHADALGVKHRYGKRLNDPAPEYVNPWAPADDAEPTLWEAS